MYERKEAYMNFSKPINVGDTRHADQYRKRSVFHEFDPLILWRDVFVRFFLSGCQSPQLVVIFLGHPKIFTFPQLHREMGGYLCWLGLRPNIHTWDCGIWPCDIWRTMLLQMEMIWQELQVPVIFVAFFMSVVLEILAVPASLHMRKSFCWSNHVNLIGDRRTSWTPQGWHQSHNHDYSIIDDDVMKAPWWFMQVGWF